jgi:hypothetical protein
VRRRYTAFTSSKLSINVTGWSYGRRRPRHTARLVEDDKIPKRTRQPTYERLQSVLWQAEMRVEEKLTIFLSG